MRPRKASSSGLMGIFLSEIHYMVYDRGDGSFNDEGTSCLRAEMQGELGVGHRHGVHSFQVYRKQHLLAGLQEDVTVPFPSWVLAHATSPTR